MNRAISFLDSVFGYFFRLALITFVTHPGSALMSKLFARFPILSDFLIVSFNFNGVGFFELNSFRLREVTDRDRISARFFTAVLMKLFEIMDEFPICLGIGDPIAVVPSSAHDGVSVSTALIFRN